MQVSAVSPISGMCENKALLSGAYTQPGSEAVLPNGLDRNLLPEENFSEGSARFSPVLIII